MKKSKISIQTEETVIDQRQEWVKLHSEEIYREMLSRWLASDGAQLLSRKEREEQAPEEYSYRTKETATIERVIILEQTLEHINITEVIKAINGIS